jgi:hypothetical protein
MLSGAPDVEERRFIVRQLLLRSQNMIRESADDISSLVNDLNNSIDKIIPKAIRENWGPLLASHQGIRDKFIDHREKARRDRQHWQV